MSGVEWQQPVQLGELCLTFPGHIDRRSGRDRDRATEPQRQRRRRAGEREREGEGMAWAYQRPVTEEVSPPIATFTNPNITQTRRGPSACARACALCSGRGRRGWLSCAAEQPAAPQRWPRLRGQIAGTERVREASSSLSQGALASQRPPGQCSLVCCTVALVTEYNQAPECIRSRV